VEEEKVVRDLARRVLSAQGYEVLDADQGDSALAASDAHRGRLRLVITDLVLPGGLSGRELAEKLRAAHPQTRFLFISGFTAAAARQRGLLGPGGHFLLMPFSPMALARRVREVLDSAAD
jgi:two-component system cell cycle sensor histidine kinase/response regulator CckA